MFNELAAEIHENAKNKGFWPDEHRDPLQVLMLIVTETAEAAEEWRNHSPGDWPINQPRLDKNMKPVGLPSEMADIIIRALDACAAWGIDIDEAIREKMICNRARPYRHGKTS